MQSTPEQIRERLRSFGAQLRKLKRQPETSRRLEVLFADDIQALLSLLDQRDAEIARLQADYEGMFEAGKANDVYWRNEMERLTNRSNQ